MSINPKLGNLVLLPADEEIQHFEIAADTTNPEYVPGSAVRTHVEYAGLAAGLADILREIETEIPRAALYRTGDHLR